MSYSCLTIMTLRHIMYLEILQKKVERGNSYGIESEMSQVWQYTCAVVEYRKQARLFVVYSFWLDIFNLGYN